jgi:hypothetical protein
LVNRSTVITRPTARMIAVMMFAGVQMELELVFSVDI